MEMKSEEIKLVNKKLENRKKTLMAKIKTQRINKEMK